MRCLFPAFAAFHFSTFDAAAQLTEGWTELPYQFIIQSPYDFSMWDRYGYDPSTRTHSFWVRPDDRQHYPGSGTEPRSEIHMTAYDYGRIGVLQFEADFNVLPGTNSTSIFQIKGGAGNVALMLRVYGNNLCQNRSPFMAITKGRWYKLNVIHNSETGSIQVYVDGVRRLTANDLSSNLKYFKCGVYNQPADGGNSPGARNETHFRNVRLLELKNPARKSQTIAFPLFPPSIAAGGAEFDPGAKATSGLPVQYFSYYEAVARTANGKVRPVSPGYAVISASQSGNAEYSMAENQVQYLIVTSPSRTSQVITAPEIPRKVVGDPDFDMEAKASSGLWLNTYSSDRRVATVTNGRIHIEGPGTTTITVVQPGNATYNPAPVLLRTLTVAFEGAGSAVNPLPGGSADRFELVRSGDGLSGCLFYDRPGYVDVTLLGIGGGKVATVDKGFRRAGRHAFSIPGIGQGPGYYILSIRNGSGKKILRPLLIR